MRYLILAALLAFGVLCAGCQENNPTRKNVTNAVTRDMSHWGEIPADATKYKAQEGQKCGATANNLGNFCANLDNRKADTLPELKRYAENQKNLIK